MSKELQDQKVAILAADGVERIELEQPRGALHGAGATTELLSIHDGEIEARQADLEPAGSLKVEKLVAKASVEDYNALLLPGGAVNPDKLRMDTEALNFVKMFARSGKPIAAICHAPWTLLEAGLVRGVRLTSWPSIRTDLRNGGADVVDEEVVVDGQFMTSRSRADLRAFCEALVEQFAYARVEQFARAAAHAEL